MFKKNKIFKMRIYYSNSILELIYRELLANICAMYIYGIKAYLNNFVN